MSTVLVTGGSGFVGSHCILQLLSAGHVVRTTVRSAKRERDVRGMLKEGGAEPGDRLSFAEADLESDAGWPEAVLGGYSVLQAESKEALAEALKGHPHFMMQDGTIEITELMPMPGM